MTIQLSSLPALLQPEVEQWWQQYLANTPSTEQVRLTQQPLLMATLPKVWACSPFVAKYCVQHPEFFNDLIDSNDLLTAPQNDSAHLESYLASARDDIAFLKALRQYRQRAMVRIAWRDLAGFAPLEETFNSLSNLADIFLEVTVNRLYRQLVTQWGTPCNHQQIPQPFVVIAMGKLGGEELNFSSDIDLMFAYPEVGETIGVHRARDNQEFFVRLGQQVIHALNHATAEGFAFRVDMRLRPFGESGPLVMNFGAMEDYCQTHARDWERYALIKARIAAGNKQSGAVLLEWYRPFVYRRYLDYNTFEALRTMKTLIDQEAQRKGWHDNIKLGAGGIREIEFICQSFQLIRGGRQPVLQQRHLLTVLELLGKYQYLPVEAVQELRAAYCFLRTTENHLQEIADQQTQTLPIEPIDQARLAYSMGYADWQSFIAVLQQHQQIVSAQFAQLVAPTLPHSAQLSQSETPWQALWIQGLCKENEARSLATLEKAGFQTPAVVLERLQQLATSPKIHQMSKRGRERLDVLIPLLFPATLNHRAPEITIQRTLDLIETVAQRSVYLALLIERPSVLELLIRLCADSAWIAEQITRYPILLDELLDPRRLYEPLHPEELDNALQAQLAHIALDDLEMQMDSMRQFKRAYVLHVAAAEISKHLTVERTSDYLAAIADTLVKYALAIAWNHLTQLHGQPYCLDGQELRPARFCVVAYGKAGGIELNYGSDLDLIFLHDSRGTQQLTDGNNPLDNQVFFSRLARRIIHILNTNTPAGVLYEVDPRLRPSGNSGLLVSSLDAFVNYQSQEAWTWEHQALVRARAVAGDCMNEFKEIRRHILQLHRDPIQLKREVCEMRSKMRETLDKTNVKFFDLKQGVGGLVDIEFIAQYGVLRWAENYPELLNKTSVLPSLKLFAHSELLPKATCEQLSSAYRAYREEVHRLTLQNQAALVKKETFAEHQQIVAQEWKNLFEL